MEKLRTQKIVAPVAAALSAVALSGCFMEKQRNAPGKSGFSENLWQRELGGDDYKIFCEGTALVKKFQQAIIPDWVSYKYPEHPACKDEKLEKTDKFNKNPFVNELNQSYYQRYQRRLSRRQG